MTDLRDSPLGHATTYAERYDRSLLFSVERKPQRDALGFGGAPPFRGVDRWTAYELSWLDRSGKPEVAIARFDVPAESPRIVESKSVKLYLTAFNLTRFDDGQAVAATLARDLSSATAAPVDVRLIAPDAFATLALAEPRGECLDARALAIDAFEPEPDALASAGDDVDEALFTRIFRSVCPVTGQPDYATVELRYRGPRIDRDGLLRYLVSFRRHAGFHEHCVERIFADVWRRCSPRLLAVGARFTRRGGVDISPYRSSTAGPWPEGARDPRQ